MPCNSSGDRGQTDIEVVVEVLLALPPFLKGSQIGVPITVPIVNRVLIQHKGRTENLEDHIV
jgi:hypothetical protein